MKKILFAHAFVATLALASCTDSSITYDIQGKIDPNMNGKMVYIYDRNSTDPLGDVIDSTTVEDGKFIFNGTLESPAFLVVGTRGYLNPIIAESTPITIDYSQHPKVTSGGELNTRLLDFLNGIDQVNNKFRTKLNAPDLTQEQRMAIYAQISEGIKSAYQNLADNNLDNMLGVFAIENLVRDAETLASFDSIMNRVPLAKDFLPILKEREVLVHKDNTANGKMFADFKGKTKDGKDISLSDYVGKGNYVLVDFWASWCGPCKGEIPNLKAAHDKYKDKGLVVLGINVWDSKEAFDKSLEEENMNWEHIYASDNNDATTVYGIRGIPEIILFAPDGKIVNRVRGADIEKALNEAYKQ